MSTSAASIGTRCGFRLRRLNRHLGEVSMPRLIRDTAAAFKRWEAKQSAAQLHRLRQPDHVI